MHAHNKRNSWNEKMAENYVSFVALIIKIFLETVTIHCMQLQEPCIWIRYLYVKSKQFSKIRIICAHRTQLWKNTTKSDHNFCGKINIFSVKSTFLPKKILRSWFHGKFLSVIAFSNTFPYCVEETPKNFRETNLQCNIVLFRF